MNSLQEKIKKVIQRTGMTVADIAYATELPKESMYKWLKGTRPSDSVIYNKLESYLDGILERVSEDSTTDKPATMYGPLFERPATMKVPLTRIGKPVPQTSGKAAAGTITIMNDEPQLIVDRIDAPFMGEVEGVIEVTGESMAPTFKNGCRVAIEYYFIIDKNWQGVIRRIYPCEIGNSIQLLSENEDQQKFPPIIRQWEQIEAVFKVKARILKH